MCHITILYIYTISLNKFLNILRKSLEKTFKNKFNLYCNYIVYEQFKNMTTQGSFEQGVDDSAQVARNIQIQNWNK